MPASLNSWGRIVWLHDIEVGAKGKLMYYKDGVYTSTNLSQITNIIKTSDRIEIYTQNNIYKLRLLPK